MGNFLILADWECGVWRRKGSGKQKAFMCFKKINYKKSRFECWDCKKAQATNKGWNRWGEGGNCAFKHCFIITGKIMKGKVGVLNGCERFQVFKWESWGSSKRWEFSLCNLRYPQDEIININFSFLLYLGLTRPALYPFPATQYAYPMLSPEMTAASWHTPSMYSAASGFRSPYPSSLPINTTLSR